MHLNLIELKLRHPPQILFQDGYFDFELVLIGSVLVVASTAPCEVGARRVNSCRGWRNQFFYPGPRKSLFLFNQGRFHLFALKHKRDKHGFPRSMFVSGQTSQSVAAIDEFFNVEFQVLILWESQDLHRNAH